MRTFLIAFLAACALGYGVSVVNPDVGTAQAQEKPTVQDLYAKTLRELGRCQYQLSDLSASVVEGRYVDWTTVKAQLEAANPTYTFDPTSRKITLTQVAK